MAPLGRIPGGGRGSLKVDESPRHRWGFGPLSSGAAALATHLLPSARPPAPQTSPTRAAATSGDWGVTRAGQDWGKREERHQQRGNTRSLDPIGKEGPVLPPPTCSRLRLAPARRRWTITYRFPASAANTWERIAPARAPPRLAGAHPSHLTAEALPWRALIGAAGRAGRAPRRNSRL
uniref:Uncharacterized protein n=1 Tax=Pipistrellus kuhlii TaxID=59472 RepID=A0A7J7ZJH6_PIPKU|nr:hypothetical protein mPipKuh1_009424 [Pipistrellus kuhlii]